MIVHFNQNLQTTRIGSDGSRETFAELAGRVVESLATLLQQGQVDVRTLSTLRIHLDWIQYRANFRDPVIVRRAIDAQGRMLAAGGDGHRSAPGGRRTADAAAGRCAERRF